MRLGSDNLFAHQFDLIRHKRIGVITNHSALMSDGRHLVDALVSRNDVKVIALFGPEHGIRGSAPDRKSIRNDIDEKTGIPVYSLFGKTPKPTAGMLRNLDALLFDIQDVGVRFYTYTTTLALTMEAAAEHGIPYIVLDRPNPIGGKRIEGPLRDESLKSFVGWLPIPAVHGLTVGEIAGMINGMHWLGKSAKARLTVVKMKGWMRSMYFDQTELQWIKPSPSIRTLETAIVYPGTCFIEGSNVSEGRGTAHPFECVGAPWIDGRKLAHLLNAYGLPGVSFHRTSFTPRTTRSLTTDSKYEGERCGGVFVDVTDRAHFEPVRTGIFLLSAIQKLYPEQFVMRPRRLDDLTGTSTVRRAILRGDDPASIARAWSADVREFRAMRREFLLYR